MNRVARPFGTLRRRSGGSAARLRRLAASLVLSLLAGTLVSATGSPAHATDGPAPDGPTVYLSQSTVGSTSLSLAAQSRLANGGTGGVSLTAVGAAATSYDAIGLRAADGHIYGISGDRLLRVDSEGSVTDLGGVAGLPAGGLVAGSFGGGAAADTLFVLGPSTTTMYAIDPTTRTATPVSLTATVDAADVTWADGHLWGVGVEGGFPRLLRIAPDGTVTSFDSTGVLNQTETGGYGGAWTYGNGNLAFTYQPTGAITQVGVADAAGAAPTFARVSQVAGPPSSSNDATSTPAAVADLALSTTAPPPGRPGDAVSWRVTLSQSAAGASSGATFGFAVPTGVTLGAAGLPSGCAVAGARVQCVGGRLSDGDTETYDFAATFNSGFTVPQMTTLAATGNEHDPRPADDTVTLTLRPASQDRTSSGPMGSTQSTTVAKSWDASVRLLDGEARVSSLSVPGQGVYTVTPSTGVITFQPEAAFAGQASTVGFVIVPATGESASGTYVATVSPPAGPVATAQTTSGVGTEQQATGALRPAGGSLHLLDSDSDSDSDGDGDAAVASLSLDHGTYAVAGNRLVFSAHPGWAGTAAPVGYRVTDSYGQVATSTYTVTVSPPAAPVIVDLASSGPQGEGQQVLTPGRDITLLDDADRRTDIVVVAGEGTYRTVASADGPLLRFEPEPCFVGSAAAVGYTSTDAWGSESDRADYAATVLGSPVAVPLASTGVGTGTQLAAADAPCGEDVRLLDDDGRPTTSLTRAGEGTFAADPTTGRLGFTALLGYSGTPAPVPYRVTSADGATADSSYTVTVVAPPQPAPSARTSSGVGTAVQSARLPQAPPGGSVTLVDAEGGPATSVTRPGVGTWQLDPVTRVVSYLPAWGFLGTTPALPYRVTDAYDQRAPGGYTATVTLPAPPTATSTTATGPVGAIQEHHVDVPDGGSFVLLDAEQRPRTVVRKPGVGVYRWHPVASMVTFVPRPQFVGRAGAVAYAVVDSYGQRALGSFRARVATTAPEVGTPRLHAPRLVRGVRSVPARCSLSTGRTSACVVTVYARVDGRRVAVGSAERRTKVDPGRRLGVAVPLDGLGRALARRPGGVRLQLRAAVRQAEVGTVRRTTATTRVQARRVELAPVHFGADRASVRRADRAYLLQVRSRLRGVLAVICVGFTDARGSRAHNRGLALRRARSACAALVGHRSVATVAVARGEARPAHSNATEHGRARNRRAEITLRY